MDECGHTRLQLASGGYYLGCADCGKRWVAVHQRHDQAIDREPRFGHSIQPLFEYVLKPIAR